MTARDEDELWRSIVENYGERARLDEDNPGDTLAVEPEPADEPDPYAAERSPVDRPDPFPEDVEDEADADQDGFVPPPPPDHPPLPWRRKAAWGLLLGIPVLLLVLVAVGARLPSAVGLLVAAGFVGAFSYLVATMEKGPRNPWDDGSVV